MARHRGSFLVSTRRWCLADPDCGTRHPLDIGSLGGVEATARTDQTKSLVPAKRARSQPADDDVAGRDQQRDAEPLPASGDTDRLTADGYNTLASATLGHGRNLAGVVLSVTNVKRTNAGESPDDPAHAGDYHLSFVIADPSRPDGMLITVFRRRQTELPGIPVGSPALFRSVQVVSWTGKTKAQTQAGNAAAMIAWLDGGVKVSMPLRDQPPLNLAPAETGLLERLGRWSVRESRARKDRTLDSVQPDTFFNGIFKVSHARRLAHARSCTYTPRTGPTSHTRST